MTTLPPVEDPAVDEARRAVAALFASTIDAMRADTEELLRAQGVSSDRIGKAMSEMTETMLNMLKSRVEAAVLPPAK